MLFELMPCLMYAVMWSHTNNPHESVACNFLFRYLLRKLLQFQSASDGAAPLSMSDSHSTAGVKSSKSPASHSTTPDHALDSSAKKSGSKKRATPAGAGSSGESKKKMQSQAAKDLLGESTSMSVSTCTVQSDTMQEDHMLVALGKGDAGGGGGGRV